MKAHILDLENLRREYEKCSYSSSSLSEALERGWTDDSGGKRDAIEANRLRAETVEAQLVERVKNLKRCDRDVVNAWVAIHVETCLQLLQGCIGSDNPRAGVRTVCLSDVLQDSAKQLKPSSQTFTVNGHYLPDYYDVYDAILVRRYG